VGQPTQSCASEVSFAYDMNNPVVADTELATYNSGIGPGRDFAIIGPDMVALHVGWLNPSYELIEEYLEAVGF
jgi:hypothetical protein